MNKLILLLVLCFAGFLIYKFGLAVGGISFCLCMLIIFLLYHTIDHIMTIHDYAKQYENIYVVSNHPKLKTELFIEDLDEFIINVPYKEVLESVEDQKKILVKAKNELFNNDNLKVIPIIYQDGQFVNETWKQFKKRVSSEIKEDRAKRHKRMKQTDNIWYMQYSNYQNGVSWKK